ncbi:BnaCnng30930D [Brassica napus]|uniref:protein-serine/threonine phosphatase n=1 Tax=Brassica napus TaxID=3708 RepID=A0A078J361_BRANA|nr:unnamed protein product [Brassica napus]CDY56675.1 BnaCnng30930D [Brassica napus]
MSKSWSMNHREVSYTFGPENVDEFLRKNDMDLICNAQQLAIIFSAPNYCSDFDNAGALISVDESLMYCFQILKHVDRRPGLMIKRGILQVHA